MSGIEWPRHISLPESPLSSKGCGSIGPHASNRISGSFSYASNGIKRRRLNNNDGAAAASWREAISSQVHSERRLWYGRGIRQLGSRRRLLLGRNGLMETNMCMAGVSEKYDRQLSSLY